MPNQLQELRESIEECYRLGFDSVREAVEAVLRAPDFAERWECSPRLVRAVEAFHAMRARLREVGRHVAEAFQVQPTRVGEYDSLRHPCEIDR